MAPERKETKKTVNRETENADIWLQALENEDGMTDWEKEFVASVSDTFYMTDRKLSQRQYEVLEKIYRKWN
jgi:hypothetical protein